MPTINVNNFSRGKAHDYTNGALGEFAYSKLFDISTFPQRLYPRQGITTTGQLTDSKIGKMIQGENGSLFAIGTDPNNPTLGELYKQTGFGTSDVWTDFTADQLSAGAITVSSGHYNFLVHFPEATGSVRRLYWSSTNKLVVSDPDDGGGSANTSALTFTFIGQGIVHPKDKTLYFPYTTSSASVIGYIPPGGSEFTGLAAKSDLLSPRYISYGLSWYRDYLAIPLTTSAQSGTGQRSIVALWDRDTSLTTVNETIPWGDGKLKVLANLDSALIGISEVTGYNASDRVQNVDKIEIKLWDGFAAPVTIKELVGYRIGSSRPVVSLRERVNFVRGGRLYFSADIELSTTTKIKGLWSVGKNLFGEWTVVLEHVSPDGTSINAATMAGNFVTFAYSDGEPPSTEGQLAKTVSSNTVTSIWTDNSVYESTINQDMPTQDKWKKKQLESVYCTFLPLLSSGSVQMQYRVDSSQDGSWTTIFTETTDGEVRAEGIIDSNGAQFEDGTNYEFRIVSTGGATITGWGYKYDTLDSQV